MFCYKCLNSVLLWGNILGYWMIILCLTGWFYTWVCIWVQLEWTERCCGKLCFEVKNTVNTSASSHWPPVCVYILEGYIKLSCWNCIALHATPTHLRWSNYDLWVEENGYRVCKHCSRAFLSQSYWPFCLKEGSHGRLISLMWWLSVHCLIFLCSRRFWSLYVPVNCKCNGTKWYHQVLREPLLFQDNYVSQY